MSFHSYTQEFIPNVLFLYLSYQSTIPSALVWLAVFQFVTAFTFGQDEHMILK